MDDDDDDIDGATMHNHIIMRDDNERLLMIPIAHNDSSNTM